MSESEEGLAVIAEGDEASKLNSYFTLLFAALKMKSPCNIFEDGIFLKTNS